MSKELIFFCCACCILLLTTINLSVGFIISGKDDSWGTLNCAQYQDNYDENIKDTLDSKGKDIYEKKINECKNKKGFHDMEYTTFIFDIIIGFICGLLGLLHLFNANTGFISKTGLIGLICGIIGFILTFVYIILNGIVFTSYGDFIYLEGGYSTSDYKIDSDGVYAEWDSGNNMYKCTYFDEDDPYALYAKYSDLIQKQYNYDKDYYFESSDDVKACWNNYINCNNKGYISNSGLKIGSCDKLYMHRVSTISNKDKADRFLTTLILSLIVCIANIGLAIFGFLLFKN